MLNMETEIFDYGMNGEGVAKIDGKIALVPFALIGEKVDVEIVADNKNYCQAKLNKILTPSKNRVAPPCPYFYSCGGCALQHMNYAEQLEFKTSLVKKTIKKIANLDVEVEPCVACENEYNYRNKISFVFDGSFGFYKFNSKDIVAISECKIASENINKILALANEFFKDKPYKNELKNLVVRDINNQLLVGVVAKKFLEIGDFYAFLAKNFKKIGLFLIINKRNDAVVLTNNCLFVGGISEIEIENFGLKYGVDLLGFHQTNLDIQNKIYARVLNLIDNEISASNFGKQKVKNVETTQTKTLNEKQKNIINGFSGAGLLSGVLAKAGNKVYGIEISKSSHKSSEKLKAENNLTNLTNICGDFNAEFKKLDADILVLDPPKKGVGENVLKQVKKVKQIIYISCNPIALAKDLRYLKNYYIIKKIIPFDMFPNTNSVETLVNLKLKES